MKQTAKGRLEAAADGRLVVELVCPGHSIHVIRTKVSAVLYNHDSYNHLKSVTPLLLFYESVN